MKIKRNINWTGFKMKPPVWLTLTVILALSHWDAAQWVCGVVGAILGMIWIVYFIEIGREDETYSFDMEELIKLKLLKKDE